MAIFGNATGYNRDGTVMNIVIGTTIDVYLNYIWGVLILAPFIISTLINPVVFIYKYNQPRSAACLLYMMLSASDFLTTLLRPIILSYELLKPGLDEYLPLTNICTTTRLFRGFYYNLFTELSLATTASLAVMRFIAIQFPFYRPRKRLISGAIVAWTLICVLPLSILKVWICYNRDKTESSTNEYWVTWMRPTQSFLIGGKKERTILKIEIVRGMIITIISFVASGLAVIAMLRNRNTPNTRSRNKGCVPILVMNAALIMALILIIKDAVYPLFQSEVARPDTSKVLSLFVLNNVPVFLSTFNPLVIVLFSSQIKEFIRAKLGLLRVHVQSNETRTEPVEMNNLSNLSNLNNLNNLEQPGATWINLSNLEQPGAT